jgi:hypothetical protein
MRTQGTLRDFLNSVRRRGLCHRARCRRGHSGTRGRNPSQRARAGRGDPFAGCGLAADIRRITVDRRRVPARPRPLRTRAGRAKSKTPHAGGDAGSPRRCRARTAGQTGRWELVRVVLSRSAVRLRLKIVAILRSAALAPGATLTAICRASSFVSIFACSSFGIFSGVEEPQIIRVDPPCFDGMLTSNGRGPQSRMVPGSGAEMH